MYLKVGEEPTRFFCAESMLVALFHYCYVGAFYNKMISFFVCEGVVSAYELYVIFPTCGTQVVSHYDADELAVMLELLLDLKSFVEKNQQFFLAPGQIG